MFGNQPLESEFTSLAEQIDADCRQAHEAIGELRHDASGKCIETPDATDMELAVLTIDDVLRRAKELEDLYDAGFRS